MGLFTTFTLTLCLDNNLGRNGKDGKGKGKGKGGKVKEGKRIIEEVSLVWFRRERKRSSIFLTNFSSFEEILLFTKLIMLLILPSSFLLKFVSKQNKLYPF